MHLLPRSAFGSSSYQLPSQCADGLSEQNTISEVTVWTQPGSIRAAVSGAVTADCSLQVPARYSNKPV
ncbi:hypothetical protein Q9966_001991 [Columba livia]|nr:hypothetical protein Q9966_001991 [Columba livia]